jgi:hypothetical protein
MIATVLAPTDRATTQEVFQLIACDDGALKAHAIVRDPSGLTATLTGPVRRLNGEPILEVRARMLDLAHQAIDAYRATEGLPMLPFAYEVGADPSAVLQAAG